jgi:hypothetical protein
MKILVKEPNVDLTFPQANDIKKLIKIGDGLVGNANEEKLQYINLDITERQLSYYYSSGVYLGLFEQKEKKLTRLGELVFSQKISTLMSLIVYLILENRIFYEYYTNRDLGETVQNIIHNYSLNKTTALRRAENVRSWVQWCDIIIIEQDLNISGV